MHCRSHTSIFDGHEGCTPVFRKMNYSDFSMDGPGTLLVHRNSRAFNLAEVDARIPPAIAASLTAN